MGYSPPVKGADNIVRETHVYTGPLGSGIVEYEYRMSGAMLQMKVTHIGPEPRSSHGWQDVPDSEFTTGIFVKKEPHPYKIRFFGVIHSDAYIAEVTAKTITSDTEVS